MFRFSQRYPALFRAGLLLVLPALLATCKHNPEPQPAEAVTKFYEKLFQIAEQNSINRRTIDWVSYRQKVLAKVGAAQTVPETELAMTLALALLNDNHSTMIVDGKQKLYGGLGCQAPPAVTPPLTFTNVGYVEVQSFVGSSAEQKAVDFAQAIQNNIARYDDPALKGWIVDLRRNTGGNMGPMIAGLGPLIGEGVCGYFYDIDNKPTTSFAYQNGASLDGQRIVTTVTKPYQIAAKNPKVAVLIGGATQSSGEATAIAFAGRPNTRFFGSSSCGLSTINNYYDLPFYGYTLNLTIGKLGDRTGKVYGKSVVPDEVVSDDQVISKAIQWLSQ